MQDSSLGASVCIMYINWAYQKGSYC